MAPERWERIAELYHAACEQPPGKRSAFVADAAGGDEELRDEVESLLRQDVSQDGVVDRAARHAALVATGLSARIDRYRTLRVVGEGGMGIVYEAEQDHPRRTVALKILKTGAASPELLRRFERESEALGRLQHPGIAQIYEAGAAGTDFGPQPYLAMEFIRGLTLFEGAAARGLDTGQRLEIMAKVCDAVEHAHQRGIVHRDLKPNNILLDESGQPKILDFGVARITDGDAQATRQTDLGQLVGTLAYMSPEQVLGDPSGVDARSDIYSLGVVLYELLAGRLPYEAGREVYDAVRTIREEDPAPLSTFSRAFRGDLETIAAKALEKDRARRYGSAGELAADIRRYLNDEPILARPASAMYQLKKFSVRHKGPVGAVLGIFAVLVAGISISTTEAIRAARAERAAIVARDRATVAERNATMERDRALVSERAANDERNHALRETSRADTEAATAKSISDFLQQDLLALASIEGQSAPNARPDPDLKVRTALDRAAASIATRRDLTPVIEGAIRDTIGNAYAGLGLFPQAVEQLQRAFDLRRQALGTDSQDTMKTAGKLAHWEIILGRASAAEAILTSLIGTEPRREVSDTGKLGLLVEMATLSANQGNYARAEKLTAYVLKVTRRIKGPNDPDTLVAMDDLGVQYQNQGKYTEAVKLGKEALELKKKVLGPDHPTTLMAQNNLGVDYRRLGRFAEAEAEIGAALAARRRLEGDQHLDTIASMISLGNVYMAEGKYDQAGPMLENAWQTGRVAVGPEQATTLAAMNNLADLYMFEGRQSEAESLYRRLLETRRRVFGDTHPNTARVLASLGELKLGQQAFTEAEPLLREAWKAREKSSPAGWERYYAESLLGAALCGQKRYAEAEPLLTAGYAGLMERRASIPFEQKSNSEHVRQWIVQLYEDWGRPEQATCWRAAGHPYSACLEIK
jgi:tetratricopeptide (TPR) repeat protein